MADMINDEIYSSRNRVAKILIENLREFGNLERPGIVGRAYNAGTKSNYRFSCSNYLRFEAETRKYPYRDSRWYSEDKIIERKYNLRSYALPMKIEYWHGDKDGEGLIGNLKNFYNAGDIIELENTEEIPEGNQPNDKEYAQGFLMDNGVKIDRRKCGSEYLFGAMYEHAKSKGLNEFCAKMSAQLFMKNCRLEYDYEKNPLFTEDEIKRMERNPRIIFYSMKQANNLLRGMEDNLWNMKSLKQRAETLRQIEAQNATQKPMKRKLKVEPKKSNEKEQSMGR